MNLRSHSASTILDALADGLPVWMLDTGNDGEDDVLIGDYQDVVADILDHFDLDELPDHWSLERLVSRE
jgi:hypothetical protein